MTPWQSKESGKTWETRGEALVERELRRERRAGVDHYVVGQYHAEEVEQRAAILSYVTRFGVVAIPMVKEEGGAEWKPLARACRVCGLDVDYGPRPLPEDWELNEEMKAALERLG